MKTDILPETVEWRGHGRGTARAPGRAEIAQNYSNGWVRPGQWRPLHQAKLSAETPTTSPIWMPAVCSVVQYSGDCGSFLKKGTK